MLSMDEAVYVKCGDRYSQGATDLEVLSKAFAAHGLHFSEDLLS